MQLQGTEVTNKKQSVNYIAINLPISWLYTKLLKHKIASAKRQRRLELFHILLLFVLRIAALSGSKRHLPTSWSVLKLNPEIKKKKIKVLSSRPGMPQMPLFVSYTFLLQ